MKIKIEFNMNCQSGPFVFCKLNGEFQRPTPFHFLSTQLLPFPTHTTPSLAPKPSASAPRGPSCPPVSHAQVHMLGDSVQVEAPPPVQTIDEVRPP